MCNDIAAIMNRCFSRPTVAYTIGAIHSVINIVAAIYFIKPMIDVTKQGFNTVIEFHPNPALCISVASCLLAILFGALMVAGVFMKRYKLMAPYVHFGIVGLVCSGLLWVVTIGVLVLRLSPFTTLCDILTRAILVEGIQVLLWLPIFSIYKEWKEDASGTQSLRQTDNPIQYITYQAVYGVETVPIPAPSFT